MILCYIWTTELESIPLGEPLPYGTHHINPLKGQSQGGLFAEFILNSKGLLKKTILQAVDDISCKKENSNDPAVRLAFASRLDTETRSIQDKQVRNFYLILMYSFAHMIWYDIIWYDMIWYDMIWYDMKRWKILKGIWYKSEFDSIYCLSFFF